MSSYVVVGAGPVGRETARLLAEHGHRVILTSRHAGSIDFPAGHAVSTDATDAAELARISKGADAIFMCAMPSYDRWPTDFFPILDGTVSAAESVGARIIVLGNLYGYGERAANPHTSDAPLDPTTRKGTVRTIMWERARRSRAPALEIRASDYLGQNAVGHFSLLALPPLLERKEVGFPGDLDASHAWAFTKDVARTLVAAAGYKGEWGRAFLAPSRNASVRELVEMFAAQRHISVPQLLRLTTDELEAAGYHELIEMAYLFDRPFLVDTSDTETQLGVRASSLDEMIEDTLRGFIGLQDASRPARVFV